MTTETSQRVMLDSLVSNEFAFEINGERVNGVLHIGHLVTFRLQEDGTRILPPFEVSKIVERDANSVFNTWLRETISGREVISRPRRDVTIVAVDDGVVTRRWTARNAWIREVRYSAFDSTSFEMVAETYVIAYDDMEDSWPATSESPSAG
jgi:hypothetical protein